MTAHFESFHSYVPLDLRTAGGFLLAFAVVFAVVCVRYALVAGIFWFYFYALGKGKRPLYAKLPSAGEQRAEIVMSLESSLVFALFGAGLGLAWQLGWTRLYLRFDEYGWWYLPVSFVVAAFLHDAYFYVTHRWLHVPALYRRWHKQHHRSREPSPWASFAFSPVEAAVQAAAVPLIALVLPLHPTVVIAYLTFMTVSATINHLGFEVVPENAWFISGSHHAAHHRLYRYNYGLFFTHLDRAFGSEAPR